MIMMLIIIIIIIIIIIRHELGLSRPVSASSNILFKGLPNRLRLFGLQSQNNFKLPFKMNPIFTLSAV